MVEGKPDYKREGGRKPPLPQQKSINFWNVGNLEFIHYST